MADLIWVGNMLLPRAGTYIVGLIILAIIAGFLTWLFDRGTKQ